MPAGAPSSCNCYPSGWLSSGGCKRSWAKTHSLARAIFAQSCFSSPGNTNAVPRRTNPRAPYTCFAVYPAPCRYIPLALTFHISHCTTSHTLPTCHTLSPCLIRRYSHYVLFPSLWPVPGPGPSPRPPPLCHVHYIPHVSYIPLHLICALFTYAVHMLSHFTTYYHLRTLASWTLPLPSRRLRVFNVMDLDSGKLIPWMFGSTKIAYACAPEQRGHRDWRGLK